jgi:SAM-dependent methyltransferase
MQTIQGTGQISASDWGSTFNELWWQLGPETKTAIVEILPQEWSIAGKRILDFGCGPGRTLNHFAVEAEHAEIWGVDIDRASIDELRRALVPPFRAMQCGHQPPLELDSGSFDLAWAISVFTHLTDNSIAWLLELHRLLKPGGLLIATYIGRWTSEFIAGEPWEEDRTGMNVLRHDNPWDQGGPFVLISDWWMVEHWGRAFEVVRIEPRIHNQSWVLLRKRDVQLTEQDLLRPANDPRELAAARHNLRQVQRESEYRQHVIETERAKHAEAMAQLRSSFEHSRSWRITAPLRQLAGFRSRRSKTIETAQLRGRVGGSRNST